ncbi:hypothetical protein CEQ90_12350 [Lewinellaceae bacterium SD302]|nr:hypothetical protein CEQ90_12350 [Lewinellaceae bacterium SD302]
MLAQTPPRQVVTKTIEDTYAYSMGNEVAVEGEKAEIFVETWAKQTISIRLEMTAKHENIETAQRELENLEFVTEVAGQKIFLKNTRKDKNVRPESELIVNYYITLPEECPVYLKSHFGGATISNLKNRLRINGEYSQINIDNVQGLLDIRTRFGDIVGEKIDGNVVINSRRSDIELFDVGGSFTINAQYGELRLSPNRMLTDLQVNADKSDVYLFDPSGSPMQYTLTATHAELNLPNEIPLTELENNSDLRSVRIGSGRELAGRVMVSVSFGKLYLEKEKAKRVRQNGF